MATRLIDESIAGVDFHLGILFLRCKSILVSLLFLTLVFQKANLWRSTFFTAEMDARADASFPLDKLLLCNKVKSLTSSIDAIRAAVRASSSLVLTDDNAAYVNLSLSSSTSSSFCAV
jgi:hypothetical protein